MKKIISILAVCCFPILFSCNKDPLDLIPDGRLTLDEVFQDESMAAEYLNTIYDNINPYGTAYDFWTMLAGFSDEAHDNSFPEAMGSGPGRWYNGELRPDWNPLDIPGIVGSNDPSQNGNYYKKYWAAVRQTNIFLEGIQKTVFSDPALKARLIAEAKTLRAFFYLELIKMFGGMPVVDKPFGDDYKFADLPRQSFNECAAFIKKNCDEAIAEEKFPYRITNEPDRGRFTKAIAHAIRSQALLFAASPLWNTAGDANFWIESAKASKASLNDLLANNYKLFPDYESYFFGRTDLSVNPSDKETIFEIKPYRAHEFSYLMYRMHAVPSVGGDKAGASPSQELVDSYDMKNGEQPILGYSDEDHLNPVINPAAGYDDNDPYKNRDPRFYATVWYNNAYYGIVNGQAHYVQSYIGGADGISSIQQRTHNGYYLRKFRNPQQRDPNAGTARFKKYRLAEIYLNYAEAANEAYGPIGDVYQAVNVIRERAGMPPFPAGLSKDQMRERIKKERQVELAFEEFRFWDVRRWKILDKTDKLTTGMLWTKTGNNFTVKRVVVGRRKSWTNNHLIFPIPTSELSMMPLWQQNPGWN